MYYRTQKSIWLAVIPALCLIVTVTGITLADSVQPLNQFAAGTVASADEVNANFAACEVAINDNDTRIMALETAQRSFAAYHSQPSGALIKSFNQLAGGSPITITKLGTGEYELDFGDATAVQTAMNNAYFQVTKGGLSGPGFATVEWGGAPAADKVTVRTYDETGTLEDAYFYLTVH